MVKKHALRRFKNDLLTFLNHKSPLRKKNPEAFKCRKQLDDDGSLNSGDRDKLLLKFLTPGRGMLEGQHKQVSPKFKAQSDLFARKIKAANYGKWFLQPKDYNRKPKR